MGPVQKKYNFFWFASGNTSTNIIGDDFPSCLRENLSSAGKIPKQFSIMRKNKVYITNKTKVMPSLLLTG